MCIYRDSFTYRWAQKLRHCINTHMWSGIFMCVSYICAMPHSHTDGPRTRCAILHNGERDSIRYSRQPSHQSAVETRYIYVCIYTHRYSRQQFHQSAVQLGICMCVYIYIDIPQTKEMWLFCGEIKHCCGDIGLFCTVKRDGVLDIRANRLASLPSKLGMCGDVGPFCGKTGLIGGEIGLFCGDVGFFCTVERDGALEIRANRLTSLPFKLGTYGDVALVPRYRALLRRYRALLRRYRASLHNGESDNA